MVPEGSTPEHMFLDGLTRRFEHTPEFHRGSYVEAIQAAKEANRWVLLADLHCGSRP